MTDHRIAHNQDPARPPVERDLPRRLSRHAGYLQRADLVSDPQCLIDFSPLAARVVAVGQQDAGDT